MADNTITTKKSGKKGNGGVIIACILIVSLIIVVAAIVILLLVYNTGGSEIDNVTVGQITVNNANGSTPVIIVADKPHLAQEEQPKPSAVNLGTAVEQLQKFDKNVTIPEYKPLAESETLAGVKEQPTSGGLMNAPEAKDKKWDPEKNFPSRVAPVRGDNTLGSKFGPTEVEMQMNLPTAEELYLANTQNAGPKFIRKGPLHKRGNDYRPIMIPQDYQDYDSVRRPNRPRINEQHFEEALEIQKRMYDNHLPGIIAPSV